jgi:hypothetical protein
MMSHASARRGSCYADGWDSGPAVEAMGWVGERLAIASVDRIDGPLLNYMSRESVGARKSIVRWWQCNDVEVTKTLRSRELLPRSCYPASTTVGFLGTGRPSPSLYPRQPRTRCSMARPAFRLCTIRTDSSPFYLLYVSGPPVGRPPKGVVPEGFAATTLGLRGRGLQHHWGYRGDAPHPLQQLTARTRAGRESESHHTAQMQLQTQRYWGWEAGCGPGVTLLPLQRETPHP